MAQLADDSTQVLGILSGDGAPDRSEEVAAPDHLAGVPSEAARTSHFSSMEAGARPASLM